MDRPKRGMWAYFVIFVFITENYKVRKKYWRVQHDGCKNLTSELNEELQLYSCTTGLG